MIYEKFFEKNKIIEREIKDILSYIKNEYLYLIPNYYNEEKTIVYINKDFLRKDSENYNYLFNIIKKLSNQNFVFKSLTYFYKE